MATGKRMRTTSAECHDYEYLRALGQVWDCGEPRDDRTGTGTTACFGWQMRFDLRERFPLLTSKRMFWKGIVEELLWFLRAEHQIQSLQARGVHIWDEWANENGYVGPIYGAQWRAWVTSGRHYLLVDQIENLIEGLKKNPTSRRHVVSAWNVADLEVMALPPCHMIFQCYVSNSGHLSLKMTQRSADMFLGVPFNIASYALLTHMLAAVTGLKPGELIIDLGDFHIYRNHEAQVLKQLEIGWRHECPPSPRLLIADTPADIDSFSFDNFILEGYDPLESIPAPISV